MNVTTLDAPARRDGHAALSSGWWTLGAILLVGAAALRLPGLFTDLWLDEIWSIHDVLAVRTWTDIFLQLKIDNNHHLNSLYLLWIGPESNVVTYRLLAFASGLAAVITAWMIGARDTPLTATITALVFGTSFLMAFYSSEARGYASVVWLTLAAWYFAQRYVESPRPRFVVGFTVCCALGILAHQTFLLFFVGAFLWCDVRIERSRSSVKAATRLTMRLFLPSAVFIAMFYVVALHGQAIGGGPSYRLATVVAQLLSAVSGGPQAGAAMWTVAALVAMVSALSILSAYRSGDDRWLLYVGTGLVIPGLMVFARQPSTLSPRYFIVPATVLLLANSTWLSRLVAQGGVARLIASLLIGGHVLGGVLFAFNRDAVSRGHYRAALQQIISSTSDVVTVASADTYSGHDFRAGLLVDFYGRYLAAVGRVRYVDAAAYRNGGADWLIVEGPSQQPRRIVGDGLGNRFMYAGWYPAGSLSGTTWCLYRKIDDRNGSGAADVEPRPFYCRGGPQVCCQAWKSVPVPADLSGLHFGRFDSKVLLRKGLKELDVRPLGGV